MQYHPPIYSLNLYFPVSHFRGKFILQQKKVQSSGHAQCNFSLNLHSHKSIVIFFHWPNNSEVAEVYFCMSRPFWPILVHFSVKTDWCPHDTVW